MNPMKRGQRFRESTGHRDTVILADQWHPFVTVYDIPGPRPAHPPHCFVAQGVACYMTRHFAGLVLDWSMSTSMQNAE